MHDDDFGMSGVFGRMDDESVWVRKKVINYYLLTLICLSSISAN